MTIHKKRTRYNIKLRASLKNSKKFKKEHNIVDIPFSSKINKGTRATHGSIDYHYQNYANVMDFLNKLNSSNLCISKDAFIELDISNLKKGIVTLYNLQRFIINVKKSLKSTCPFVPVILNLKTDEGNHANILLINKESKDIELYEPHGSRTSSSELGGVEGAYRKKIRALRQFWKDILSGFTIVNAVDYQKGTAFQMNKDPVNHSGFCITWTILFIHYRILNPTVKLPILIKYISMKITTKKLLQYAKYVEDKMKGKLKKKSKKKSRLSRKKSRLSRKKSR